MKAIIGSKIIILECRSGKHVFMHGTIESKRLTKGWNVRLKSRQMCVATKVKVLKERKTIKRSFIENLLAGIGFTI